MGKNQRSNSEKGSANALLIMAAVVILFLILIVSGILLYRLLPAKKRDTGKKGTEKEETATTDEKEEMEDYTISTFHEDGISKESDDQSESTQKDEGYIEGGSDSAELPLDVEAERQRIVEIYDSINSSKLKKMKGYPSYLTQRRTGLYSLAGIFLLHSSVLLMSFFTPKGILTFFILHQAHRSQGPALSCPLQ